MRKFVIPRKHGGYILLMMLVLAGCRKFVEVPTPDTQLGTDVIFASDQTATSAMMGLYSRAMAAPGLFLNGGNSLYPSLSADECTPVAASQVIQDFSNNTLTSANTTVVSLYASAYNVIYNANTMLENLPVSRMLSSQTRRQLMGEALFMRALVYSRLVALFGDVPLETSTDGDRNAVTPRTPVAQVYRQVIADLVNADSLLDSSYISSPGSAGQRTRPNKWAARSLLARIYLYQGEWGAAAAAATTVIGNKAYQLEPRLDSVFRIKSREAIWQLQPVSSFTNSAEGYYFFPAAGAQIKPSYVLTQGLLHAFEPGDKRSTRWVGQKTIGGVNFYYPAKYKVRTGPPYTEYNMVIRLAEVYLIRAEARAWQGQLTEAVGDLDTIRIRAGLPSLLSGLSRDQVLAATMQERRVELMTEWGHRWIDLKRTGQADAILSAIKTKWKPTAILYPIPLLEIQRNPAISQNPGY